MDADDEDFLVVRTVEDADAAALGQASGVAPHEVVVEFLDDGCLNEYTWTLRIDARHDVLDRAVFAGRVHRLEDEQQGPAVLGIEHVLLFGQPRGAAWRSSVASAFPSAGRRCHPDRSPSAGSPCLW